MTIDPSPAKPNAFSWFTENLSLNNIIAIVVNIVILTVFITTISQQVNTLIDVTKTLAENQKVTQHQVNLQQLDINTIQTTMAVNSSDRRSNDEEIKDLVKQVLEQQKKDSP
jgi:divalent metal cation (Fe/Co/Zn/Cd) transporter